MMTNLATSLRAWVEQQPDIMFAPTYRDMFLARLDVFATEWEDRKGGRCINCEGAIAWHQDRRWNADGNVGPFCARCYELDTAALTAERDALKADVQHLLDTCVPVAELDALKVENAELSNALMDEICKTQDQRHKEDVLRDAAKSARIVLQGDQIQELTAQLAAGDAARAALRDALEAIVERMHGDAARYGDVSGGSFVVSDYVLDTWADEIAAVLASSPPERTT